VRIIGEGEMKVLAFEDGYDIKALLISSSVDLAKFEFVQHWTSANFLQIIRQFSPDVLLLDHFMPPTQGFDVLVALNDAVKRGEIKRPNKVIAMSSEHRANLKMISIGADEGIIKFDLATLSIWK
jgi:DNA-binding response OmpR family regulator